MSLFFGQLRKLVPAFGPAVLMCFNCYYAPLAIGKAVGGELGEGLGLIGRMAERIKETDARVAAELAAKSLPKRIDDVESTERARKILVESSSSLPNAAFLQISAEGICRLYFISNEKLAVAASVSSIPDILRSSEMRDRKFLIVDALSAQAHPGELEALAGDYELYAVSGIDAPAKINVVLASGKKAQLPSIRSSATETQSADTWTATDFVEWGVFGVLALLFGLRFCHDFMKGYRGKT